MRLWGLAGSEAIRHSLAAPKRWQRWNGVFLCCIVLPALSIYSAMFLDLMKLPSHRFVPDKRGGPPPVLDRVGKQEGGVRRVGVCDLEVYAGFLPRILTVWNRVQKVFRFETVDAAVPRAISKGGEWTLAWAKGRLGPAQYSNAMSDLRRNVVAQRLQPIGANVRSSFGLDFLVLLTPEMIAFEEKGKIEWNYYSWSEGGLVIVSGADVRKFSQKAGRPFEAALASLVLAELYELICPKIKFHRQNRGCLFDKNIERETLVESLTAMRIEPSCLRKIDAPFRRAAEHMVSTLRNYPAE